MRAALLVTCACNQAFGLSSTQLPAIDALPTSCPPVGTTPHFSPIFHQVFAQTCTSYVPGVSGTAVAQCSDPSLTSYGVGIGPTDQRLAIAVVPMVSASAELRAPRLVPEGDRMIVDNFNFDAQGGAFFAEYAPASADRMTWTYARDSGIPHGTSLDFANIGTVTRSPLARVILATHLSTNGEFDELVEQAPGSWSTFATYHPTDLGLPLGVLPFAANLTSDGLHAVFQAYTPGEKHIYYLSRASLTEQFGTATLLDGVPGDLTDAVLTDDCTRLYFSGVERILYLEQI